VLAVLEAALLLGQHRRMESLASADPVATLAELQAVQGMLAGAATAVDFVVQAMPPIACTWKGTAREAYARNLEQLFAQVGNLTSSIADARAAVTSAIGSL
jgi:hypothetical protein